MTNVSGVQRKYNIDTNRIGNSNRDAIISDVLAELAWRQAESGQGKGTYGPAYEAVGAKHNVSAEGVRKAFDAYRHGLEKARAVAVPASEQPKKKKKKKNPSHRRQQRIHTGVS
jgi:hypothetical protein